MLREWKKDLDIYNITKIFLWLLLASLLAITIMIFIIASLRSLFYFFPLNYSEGHILSLVELFKERGNYFLDITLNEYPFIHGTYPPVFIYLVGFLSGFTYSENVFFIGRCISLFSTILIVLVLYKIFVDDSRDKVLSLFFSFIFIAPLFVIHWASLVRVDMLAILFNLIGLYIYVKYNQKKSYKRFFSIIFFILAFYTKQSAVAAFLAIITYNLFKNKKEFLRLICLYSVLLLLIFYYFNHITQGQFYLHLIEYNRFMYSFDMQKVFSIFQYFTKEFLIFFIIFLINILYIKKYSIFTIYFLYNFVFLITKSKPGADMNYFIEPFLSLLILGILVFIHLIKISKNKKNEVILFSAMVLQVFFLFNLSFYKDIFTKFFLSSDYGKNTAINYYVKNSRGLILSEDMGYLIINKIKPIYEPFQFLKMSEAGMWFDNKIIDDCNNKKYSLIVAGWRILSLERMEECLAENYYLIDVFENVEGGSDYKIYYPLTK